MSTKENLLGNGTLTVAARLMSAFGVPVAAAALGIAGFFAALLLTDVRDEIKANRAERQAILIKLGAYDEKFIEIARRNDQQDVMIDRLRERGRP